MSTVAVPESALRLANDDASLTGLEQLMQRVNATLPPREFLATVSRCYGRVQRELKLADPATELRQCSSHAVLAHALNTGDLPRTILVLGCGKELAGSDSTYLESVVEELFDRRTKPLIVRRNLNPRDLQCDCEALSDWPNEGFDLVVSHSLAHFFVELEPLFAFIDQVTCAGGRFLMSHEPSAAYWRNNDCQNALARCQRALNVRRRLRRILSPSRYLAAARRICGGTTTASLTVQVNRALRNELGLAADLTTHELRRIADPHRPTGGLEAFKIGVDGFDCERLCEDWLPDFGLECLFTYDHLGYLNPRELPRYWQRVEAGLRASHPRAGSAFTALLHKRKVDVRD